MKTPDLVYLIHERSNVPRASVDRVLRELAVLCGDELQANEIANLPYFGRLVPLEQTSHGVKRRREVKFCPGRTLHKRLAKPFRRLRVVAMSSE